MEIAKFLDLALDIIENLSELDDTSCQKMNPHFVQNGYQGRSNRTRRSLKFRFFKAKAGSVYSTLGSVGAYFGSVVNVAEISKHSASLTSTVLHLRNLEKIAAKLPKQSTVSRGLEAIIQVKEIKRNSRIGLLAASAIPELPIVSNAIQHIAQLYSKKIEHMGQLLLAISMDLHWRAFQEMTFARGEGSGPAMDICRELVCLSVTHLSGNQESALDFGGLHSIVELNTILSEPCGYAVILYKLMQK
jgi:hypothetical protein